VHKLIPALPPREIIHVFRSFQGAFRKSFWKEGGGTEVCGYLLTTVSSPQARRARETGEKPVCQLGAEVARKCRVRSWTAARVT
jgi:hypothetical protein